MGYLPCFNTKKKKKKNLQTEKLKLKHNDSKQQDTN
jgi:hypothetical protein